MGFRFRKSKKILPGVRLNLSGKSASISIGPKGFKKTFSTTGRTTTTVGIPGSGISYSSRSGGSGSRAGSGSDADESLAFAATADRPTSPKSRGIALALCLFFGVLGVHRYYVGKVGTGVIWTFTAGALGIGWLVDIFTILSGGFYDCYGHVLREWGVPGGDKETEQRESIMRLFTSTGRGRLAIFLAVVAVVGTIAALTGSSEQPAGSALLGAVMVLVLAAVLILKDIRYITTPTDVLWSRWDGCRDSEPQRIRMGRAIAGGLTLRQLDKKHRAATFVGGKGGEKYSTRLTSCTCPDFKERGVPCKHIYKLASELEIRELPDPLQYEET